MFHEFGHYSAKNSYSCVGDLCLLSRNVRAVSAKEEAIKIIPTALLLRFTGGRFAGLARYCRCKIGTFRILRLHSKRLPSANIIFNLRTLASSRKWTAIPRLRKLRCSAGIYNRLYANGCNSWKKKKKERLYIVRNNKSITM